MNVLVHTVEITALAWLGGLTAYLALLSLLSLFGRRTAPVRAGTPSRIAVVIPAHDEERTIGRTLRSLAVLDYPPDRTGIFVIADNCNDGTANAARELGATVLERSDADRRGKGYALRWGFDALLAQRPGWDGFVVIDADSTASKNFLRVMDAHLRDGADAVQSSDLVAGNAGAWSSEIIRLGFTLYNFARPLGRGVIGGSAGLRGNGMCFSAALLGRVPWDAFGVTEDLQYGLTLLMNGVRVRFAPDAVVLATMPAVAANAATQRIRWERGRIPVKRRYAPKLLALALRRFSFPLLDAWIDLVTPPFVRLMALDTLMLALTAVLWMVAPGVPAAYLAGWGIVLALGLVHVFAGLASARADARLYLALFSVPRYALWKLLLRGKRGPSGSPEDWIRTTREAPESGREEKNHDGLPVSPHTHQ